MINTSTSIEWFGFAACKLYCTVPEDGTNEKNKIKNVVATVYCKFKGLYGNKYSSFCWKYNLGYMNVISDRLWPNLSILPVGYYNIIVCLGHMKLNK